MDSSPAPALRRVHPDVSDVVNLADAYRLEPTRPPASTRPRVGICMITSLDGSVTIDGSSGRLGNANDRAILLALREQADVVIVGAGTARGEGYGAPRDGTRIGVVTNSGNVDTASELFRSGAGFVITSETTPVADGVDTIRAGRDQLDIATALARLHEVAGDVDRTYRVHVEGGPTLNSSLLELDLVDELALTIAPVMVGGTGLRAAVGGIEVVRRFQLAQLLVDADGYTFGRWTRPGGAP